ncbi:MAG: hypothetical protein B7Z15_02370, partial [Rhizobiales bacterium 32-66-8]
PVPQAGMVLLTLPLYWGLQSLAAWRAVPDLAMDPHRWDKTEHGIAARASRRAAGQAIRPGLAAKPGNGPSLQSRTA